MKHTIQNKEIHILSKEDAEKFTSEKPWFCISITDTLYPDMVLSEINRVDILRLKFTDTEFNRPGKFHPDDAEKVLNYIESVWDKADVFMIRCFAGQSRSPAVAGSICSLKLNDTQILESDAYIPNMLVCSTIMSVAKKRK